MIWLFLRQSITIVPLIKDICCKFFTSYKKSDPDVTYLDDFLGLHQLIVICTECNPHLWQSLMTETYSVRSQHWPAHCLSDAVMHIWASHSGHVTIMAQARNKAGKYFNEFTHNNFYKTSGFVHILHNHILTNPPFPHHHYNHLTAPPYLVKFKRFSIAPFRVCNRVSQKYQKFEIIYEHP